MPNTKRSLDEELLPAVVFPTVLAPVLLMFLVLPSVLPGLLFPDPLLPPPPDGVGPGKKLLTPAFLAPPTSSFYNPAKPISH